MYQWLDSLASTPDFVSRESMDADIIYLDPTDPKFKEGCGFSCILLIKVDGLSSNETSHYSIQVSRDLIELTDNIKIMDFIFTESQYRYYRYHKPCGDSCDMEVTLEPLHNYQGMILMVDVFNGKN